MTYYNNYNPYGINQQTPIQPYGYQPNYMQPTQAPATNIIFVIGLENLELNTKQVNDLQDHLSHQDNNLLAKIIQQNEELIELDKQIIDLLKEK